MIDPWKNYEGYKKVYTQNRNLNQTKKRLKYWTNKLFYHQKLSSEAVDEVPIVDYIDIDGNHFYDYVFDDMKNYWPNLKGGGIMSRHGVSWETTFDAVQDFCFEHDVRCQVIGQDWWIIKK